jgi:hypothetical protein
VGEGVEVKVGNMAASPLSEVGEDDLTGVELDTAVAACIREGSLGGEGADAATGVPPPLEDEAEEGGLS